MPLFSQGESRIGERKSSCFQAAYLRTDRITKWVCMKEKAQAMPDMRMIVRTKDICYESQAGLID